MSQRRQKVAKRRPKGEFGAVLAARTEVAAQEAVPAAARTTATLHSPGSFAAALQRQIEERATMELAVAALAQTVQTPPAPSFDAAKWRRGTARVFAPVVRFPWRSAARTAFSVVSHAWMLTVPWLRKYAPVAGGARKLRVVESVSLGDKRFAAVLEVEGQRFLIGGGAGTVSLLTTLAAQPAEAGSDAQPSPLPERLAPRSVEAAAIHGLHLTPERADGREALAS